MTIFQHIANPTDSAEPVVAAAKYQDGDVVSIRIPDTVGPWLDVDGAEFPQNSLQFVTLPGGGVIAAADPITIAEFALVRGGQGAASEASRRIYENVADQFIPNSNINTYAVDLPALEVGDRITVIIARVNRLFECTSRYLFPGQVYESVFTPGQSAWTVEVVGSQLRIQSFGDGTQAVKAIFVDR